MDETMAQPAPDADNAASESTLEIIERDAEAAIEASEEAIEHLGHELKESLAPSHYQEKVKVEKELPPQLNHETFASQLFWLAIIFFVFYLLMARRTIPRIREVLEKRQTQITHDLDAAEKAKADAEKARQHYTKDLATARDRAAKLIADAQADISTIITAEQHRLDQKLARSLQEADARIEEQVSKARQDIVPVAIDITRSIVEKVLGVSADEKSASAAVAAEMKG